MDTLIAQRHPLDLGAYRLRGAQESDYSTDLITRPTTVLSSDPDQAGAPLIIYLPLDLECAPLLAALERIRFGKHARTDGMRARSTVLGYLPRNTIRRDFCTASDLATRQPAEHSVVAAYAELADRYYRQLNPAVHAQHAQQTDAHVLTDYTINGSVFTSGIINKNSALKYHYDSGNFADVWSCMLVFKKAVRGGHLVLPELNLAFELCHNSLFMFDGQGLLHGVTPIVSLTPQSYRYSIVYYSMRQMWNCTPLGGELARIRTLKAQREDRRAARLRALPRALQQARPTSPVYVPSWGAARRAPLPGALRATAVPFTLLIEAHERADYTREFPHAQIAELPRGTDRTSAVLFAREHARRSGADTYAVLSDDIDTITYQHDGTALKITPSILLAILESQLSAADGAIGVSDAVVLRRTDAPLDVPVRPAVGLAVHRPRRRTVTHDRPAV